MNPHKLLLTRNDCYTRGLTIRPRSYAANMVVREMKITTLREYVGSMIVSIVGVSSSSLID